MFDEGWNSRVSASGLVLIAPDARTLNRNFSELAEKYGRGNASVLVGHAGSRHRWPLPDALTREFADKKRSINKERTMTDTIEKGEIAVIDDRITIDGELLSVLDSRLVGAMEKLLSFARAGDAGGLVTSPGPSAPNRQVWMNGPSERLFRASGRELVQVDTTKFWHPEDVLRFYDCIRDLGDGDKFDFTYRAQGSPHDPNYWLKLRSEGEIVVAGGRRFRLSRTREAMPIDRPLNLAI